MNLSKKDEKLIGSCRELNVCGLSGQNAKVPILQVVLLFWMQLWPVAHFFSLTFGRVQQQSNSKPTQKLVKKMGNWSELHSEKKYYL